jgi:hypothetical protein
MYKPNFSAYKPEEISPQSFESNDGRFSVEIVDEDFYELTVHELSADQDHYGDKDFESIDKILFNREDIDRLIDILECAKQINPYGWGTVVAAQKKEENEIPDCEF